MPTFLILMGVSGSGKTSLGELLSQKTDWPFYDADHFHPPANVEKMRKGIPLTDEDRWPWLQELQKLIGDHIAQKQSAILACSALRKSYRKVLREAGATVKFVFLQGEMALIARRMAEREGHYMPGSLLESQFNALEAPEDAMVLDIDHPLEELFQKLMDQLDKSGYL